MGRGTALALEIQEATARFRDLLADGGRDESESG
jgi:hypothetical protein